MERIPIRGQRAPIPVIVSEEGGIATDLAGDALPGDGSSVATNAALHPRLLIRGGGVGPASSTMGRVRVPTLQKAFAEDGVSIMDYG
jgi:hypothetical protein